MEKNLTLNMDAYLPLRDVVFNTLREAILRGELKPGERLMELQLASKLGVSRTPIREAIRKLEIEGLAVTTPRRGAEVAKMTEKGMKDVLEVRQALEELAVVTACQQITKEQIQQLKETTIAFEQSMREGELSEIAKSDVAFHDLIYVATGNPKLISLLSNISEQIYRYRVEYLKEESIYPVLLREHKELIEALSNKDKKHAIEVMRTHIQNQAKTVLLIIREQE